MIVSGNGLALIKHFEGCSLKAYVCPAGKLTIGYGSTGAHVKRGHDITLMEAENLLLHDLERFETGVEALVTRPMTQGQFDALVSFAFNVGLDIDADTQAEGLGDSTLLRKFNAGDLVGAEAEFKKWNKATVHGRVVELEGLTKRRACEAAVFAGRHWMIL